MKATWSGLMVLVLLGCGDFNDAKQSERKPVSPPGIAPIDQMDGLQAENRGQPPAGNGRRAAPPADKNQPRAQPQTMNQGQGRTSIIGRKTREIVNAKEELRKPGVALVDTKSSGNNPFNVVTNAYSRAASIAGSAGIQQWIRLEYAFNGRHPSYVEVMEWMKKNPGVDLPVLPAGRLYGYNEDSGQIVVLESR